MEMKINANIIFVGRSGGKRPLSRRRDLKAIGWEFVDWIHSAYDRDQ
jgi:hypothetical protein